MEMEDDKLKSLFADFQPDLSSDRAFVERLERNLHSVEIVRQRSAELRARNRKAVVIAAFAGFVVGMLFTLTLPYLNALVAGWRLELPESALLGILANNFAMIAWTLVCGTVVFTALNAYELSLSLLKRKQA